MRNKKYHFIELEETETKIKTRIRKYSKKKFQVSRLSEEITSINGIDFINFLS